ncbi:MAG: DUF3168 domain-containing protein [Pseudomonadota bacterium]
MTYAISWPLQEGIYSLICTDPVCSSTLGSRVFDAVPLEADNGTPDDVYMTFGDEEVQDWSSGSTNGAIHLITVSVHAPRHGFSDAKQAAAAVSDAILSGGLSLTRGNVVNVRFVDARTTRQEVDGLRRIDLRFRITVQDS